MKAIIEKILNGHNLTKEEVKNTAEKIFEGQLTDAQIAAFLITLKVKGETSDEMAGIAEIICAKAIAITGNFSSAMDNCGTGGDQSGSFNVSTTAAFVLAAGGVTVAKHGNRSISSKSGSADLFEVLGIDLMLSPDRISLLLQEVGLAFLYAPNMHPKMKYVMNVRKELGIPTVFNLIGPLTNPVALETQLMGTYRRDLLQETAKTLSALGRKRAIVLNGAGQVDEATLAGEIHYAHLNQGIITYQTVNPESLGFKKMPLETIRGGSAQKNKEILLSVLKNQTSPYLDTVILNAAFGFYSHGTVDSLEAGVSLAKTCLSSGCAFDKLQQLITMQKEVA